MLSCTFTVAGMRAWQTCDPSVACHCLSCGLAGSTPAELASGLGRLVCAPSSLTLLRKTICGLAADSTAAELASVPSSLLSASGSVQSSLEHQGAGASEGALKEAPEGAWETPEGLSMTAELLKTLQLQKAQTSAALSSAGSGSHLSTAAVAGSDVATSLPPMAGTPTRDSWGSAGGAAHGAASRGSPGSQQRWQQGQRNGPRLNQR